MHSASVLQHVFWCLQPPPGAEQSSIVHASPSLQSPALMQQSTLALCAHAPPATGQRSNVQGLPSLQSPTVLQQSALGVWTHAGVPPLVGWQRSRLHALPSSQSDAAAQQPVETSISSMYTPSNALTLPSIESNANCSVSDWPAHAETSRVIRCQEPCVVLSCASEFHTGTIAAPSSTFTVSRSKPADASVSIHSQNDTAGLTPAVLGTGSGGSVALPATCLPLA